MSRHEAPTSSCSKPPLRLRLAGSCGAWCATLRLPPTPSRPRVKSGSARFRRSRSSNRLSHNQTPQQKYLHAASAAGYAHNEPINPAGPTHRIGSPQIVVRTQRTSLSGAGSPQNSVAMQAFSRKMVVVAGSISIEYASSSHSTVWSKPGG